MLTAFTGLIVVVVIFAAFLFLARRILRLALKLAFVGAIILALAAAGIFGWWRGWFATPSSPQTTPRQMNRRANANTR